MGILLVPLTHLTFSNEFLKIPFYAYLIKLMSSSMKGFMGSQMPFCRIAIDQLQYLVLNTRRISYKEYFCKVVIISLVNIPASLVLLLVSL